MLSFDKAFYDVLKNSKYDVLMGRAPDFQKIKSNILEFIFNNIIYPLIENFNIPIFSPSESLSRAITIVFYIAAAFLLLGLILFTVKRIKRRLIRRRRLMVKDFFNEPIILDYHTYLEEAEKLMRSSEFREAMRLQYISVLAALNSQKMLRVKDYKTNGQLIKELSKLSPALTDSFISAVDTFQASWFGHKPVSYEDCENNEKNILFIIKEAQQYE